MGWVFNFLLMLSIVSGGFLSAYDPATNLKGASVKPRQLEGIGIDENLSQSLSITDIEMVDENGASVRLAKYFDGKRPVILSPVYYSCPSLCNLHLNGLTDVLKQIKITAGQEFQVVSFSFDPRESHQIAKSKKESYVKNYGRRVAEKGWHFLTGDEKNIKRLLKEIGFKAEWKEDIKEWAHASVAIIVTPKGKISRYLHGVYFEPKDIKLALTEASDGKIGNIIDQIILFCYRFDPSQNKYTLAAFNIMQAAGGFFVLLMGIWLIPFWKKNKKEVYNKNSDKMLS